ncbi:acetyltransferase, ribosomal protein N-acetylase [Clostridium sartagoforme AAU1]|uniref:Acetyltransferase, ribosomal protein N-acetylase n=1 Tax=Clostridium sartagoforme AAU1 TaxID=1202534 RepID=R9CE57_9CLOT|nr:GNAT family protein [Clostridium sartagoforme]EOR27639.1 acetyltransferase, ribosomal protein N-acetylase [Clostridium sartagoforme AAU1]
MYSGQLVKLRAYKEEDIEKATVYINDEEVKKLMDSAIPFPMTKWQEEEWVRSRKANTDFTYDFAIEDLKTGKYIGGCSINECDVKNRTCVVGIMIGDKEYWGKGYGSDALKVLIKFIFEEVNMNKIKLNVFSFNNRAIACYKKVGFKEEGILKKEIYRNGRYYDEIIMAMFKDDN